MALNKKARIGIIILSVPVVLVVVAGIAAKMYFTSDRLKELVLPGLKEATHRTVGITDISLTLLPSIAVSLDGLTVSNPEGTKFGRDEFLSLDNLELRAKILPLLRGRIEIGRIVLNHPKVYLESTKEGLKNYSEKTARKKATTGATPEQASAGGFLLSNIEVNNGEIEFVNNQFDSRMLIEGFHQTAHAEMTGGANAISIEGVSEIEKFSYGSATSMYISNQPLSATMKVAYQTDTDVLTIEAINAKLKDLPLSVAGTVSKLKEETLELNLTVTSPGAQMDKLLSLVPPEMLKQAKGLSSSGDVKFSLVITGPSSDVMNPATHGTFGIAQGNIQYASLPKSISNITLAGSFDKPSAPIGKKGIGSFGIDQFSAKLGTSSVGGRLQVSNFDDPALTATLNGSVNLAEVKDYYPLEEGTEVSGLLKMAVSIDGRAKAPQSIKASGSMEFQNVTIATAAKSSEKSPPIRNLNGIITFNNQVVESKQLALMVGESDLNCSFALRNYLGMIVKDTTKADGARPSATMKLTSNQLRMADLMGPEATPAGSGEKKSAGKKSGGLVPGVDIDANVSIAKLVTEKFTFSNVQGALSESGGIVKLKSLTLNAFQGAIQTSGTIDVANEKKRPFDLDLQISGVESNSLLPSFTSFGNYLFGKLSMSTKLRGDLNDTLGLNAQSLTGNGTVNILDGKLQGLPLAQKLADYTGINELHQVNFKDWANSFSVADGRLNVKDLNVNAGASSFLLDGSQGLDGSLDYSLKVKLPQESSDRLKLEGVGGELVQYLKDKDGRVNLSFHVGGMTASPALTLDLNTPRDAAKRALESKANEGKKKLEEDLKKKAEEGIKKLFKRP